MTLTDALTSFEDALPEIQAALAVNIKQDLDSLPAFSPPLTPLHEWVQDKVHSLMVEEMTAKRLSTIHRIQSYKNYRSTPLRIGITDEDKNRAKEVPISELYEGKLIRRKQGLCPFHDERTPSFHINKNNTWRCYGCNAYGDSIDFIMKRDSLSFIDAIKYLTKKS